jgi:Fur family ferric uptake transcriptional regulator
MSSEQTIAALCRELGLRITGPRRVIMRVLSESSDHPDVVELHRRVVAIEPTIALATVYRTVSLLREKGILERREHHDHLINIETGDVIEFQSAEIERLQEEIARQHGFTIISHRLEIYVKPIQKERRSRQTRE